MGRWADLDTVSILPNPSHSLVNVILTPPQDEERLPEGVERVGYDADTQTYTFLDRTTGRHYESAPGARYGVLNPVGVQNRTLYTDRLASQDYYDKSSIGFIERLRLKAQIKRDNKESLRLLLPFALLVLVLLMLLFWFVNSGTALGTDHPAQIQCGQGGHAVQIQKEDSCWAIAKAHGLGVEDLLKLAGNEGVDCDKLTVGSQLCVPTAADV
jgi:hypothetical protein